MWLVPVRWMTEQGVGCVVVTVGWLNKVWVVWFVPVRWMAEQGVGCVVVTVSLLFIPHVSYKAVCPCTAVHYFKQFIGLVGIPLAFI